MNYNNELFKKFPKIGYFKNNQMDREVLEVICSQNKSY